MVVTGSGTTSVEVVVTTHGGVDHSIFASPSSDEVLPHSFSSKAAPTIIAVILL